ncbi:tyrosine-type recombinase/integrase [Candidatus Woesearchaeota archaeon]|nr:tyrosine-type recombinase/integrase [Candidatus Woesearchaeota archaeon]
MGKDLKPEIYDLDNVLDKALSILEKDEGIIEANKKNILNCLEEAKARGVSKQRLSICIYHLRRLGKLTKKDFRKLTKADTIELMKGLESSKYADWTKIMCKKLFKALMRSYKKSSEIYSWIKTPEPPNKLKKENLLTPDEVRQLIVCAPNNMWRALIGILSESGCRPGEALNLTISSVKPNGDHVKIYTAGKLARSAGERPIFILKNKDLVMAWLAEHPSKDSKDDLNSPLWITKRTCKPITLSMLGTILKRIARNAGITKRVYPYILRHTVATAAYCKFAWPLAQKMMGHANPDMANTYVHLAEDDVLEALQQEQGIKPKKEKTENPELCQHCGYDNPYGNIQCNKCKQGLGTAGAIVFETNKEKEMAEFKELKGLLADPEIVSILHSLKNPNIIEAIKKEVRK